MPPIDLVIWLYLPARKAEKYSLYSGMPYSLLEICAFRYNARKREWILGAVHSLRVSLSICKSSHVTPLKMVERLPTHSGYKLKLLQCPIGPYMSWPCYVSDLISYGSLPCLRCYSHTGPLADFLTSQAHSCLNISSEPWAPLPPGMCSSQPSVPEVMLKYPLSRDHPLGNSIPLLGDFSLTLHYFCFQLLPPSIPSSDIFYICSHLLIIFFSSLFSEAQWDLELDVW